MIIAPMFHQITDNAQFGHPITTEEFEKQLDWLETQGKIVPASKMRKPGDKHKIVLTFDDGTLDHYEVVYPILKRRGLSGLFAVCEAPVFNRQILPMHMAQMILQRAASAYPRDDHCGEGFFKFLMNFGLGELGPHILRYVFQQCVGEERYFAHKIYLQPNHIEEMAQNGMEFASHGYNHASDTNFGEAASVARHLGALDGVDVKTFVAPWGQYVETYFQSGNIFDAVFIVKRGENSDDDFIINRVDCKDLPPFTEKTL